MLPSTLLAARQDASDIKQGGGGGGGSGRCQCSVHTVEVGTSLDSASPLLNLRHWWQYITQSVVDKAFVFRRMLQQEILAATAAEVVYNG